MSAEGMGTAAGRSGAFLERARLEADRYGPDPWILVRELLQNSRDAGARNVRFTVHEGDGIERVTCLDDGQGMSFDHARRYLFSLYASSKEDDRSQAGKFGVGFWSVLRFEPISITIRSRTHTDHGWGLRLDGNLDHAARVEPLDRPGTEITLERSGGDGRLEHRIYDAVRQNGRYLHCRENPDQALAITVGDRAANADFTLAAPSAAFRRGTVRGVVGLGPAPRVELFSRGLRVRSAACLEDLVASTGRHTSRMRVQFPELPGGLAPQALLESNELEVMLSRSDARDNRALARLVRLAQRELERLIDRQLAHARPQAWWGRLFEAIRTRLRESLVLRTLVGAAMGALLALGTAWFLWGDRATPEPKLQNRRRAAAVAGLPTSGPRPYRDLGPRYRGPKVDVLAPGSAEPIELRYRPERLRLHLASLTLARLADDGSPRDEPVAKPLHDYVGATCTRECLDVSVPMATDGVPTRIPTPTGYRIVEGSVRLDGVPIDLRASAEGHPIVAPGEPRRGVLAYQAVRSPDPGPRRSPATTNVLPQALVAAARDLRPRPVRDRVSGLQVVVQKLVRYDRTPEIARRHAEALAAGEGFVVRTLSIGAGDCDVQNGLLVAMLHAAGVEARLAVGYLGVQGETLPFLHAWVEYRDEDGAWYVADASEGAGAGLPRVARAPAAPDAPAVEGPTKASKGRAGAADAHDGETDGVVSPAPQGRPMPDLDPESPASASRAPAVSPDPQRTPSVSSPEEHGFVERMHEIDDRWAWALRACIAALLGFATWTFVSGRTRRAIKLDQGADLSRLLRGVLQQPGAFSRMSALFHRPLVPLLEGGAISLNKARELAALGRLYRTHEPPSLAMQAVKNGAAVLDDRAPEGRTVADALGAIDLDRWSQLLTVATTDPATEHTNATLRRHGEDWGIRISRDVPGSLAVLDLGPLGTSLRGLHCSRIVLVDERLPWLARAREVAKTSPRVAAFMVLDHVADHLDIPPERRARLLADAARIAVAEGAIG